MKACAVGRPGLVHAEHARSRSPISDRVHLRHERSGFTRFCRRRGQVGRCDAAQRRGGGRVGLFGDVESARHSTGRHSEYNTSTYSFDAESAGSGSGHARGRARGVCAVARFQHERTRATGGPSRTGTTPIIAAANGNRADCRNAAGATPRGHAQDRTAARHTQAARIQTRGPKPGTQNQHQHRRSGGTGTSARRRSRAGQIDHRPPREARPVPNAPRPRRGERHRREDPRQTVAPDHGRAGTQSTVMHDPDCRGRSRA